MESSYRARTGHERGGESRLFHTSTGLRATKRRKSALDRLKIQLKAGLKTAKDGDQVSMFPEDVQRVFEEIATLEKRV